jgi:hypothetical protein
VSLLADDNVIVHGDTERLRHGDDLLRHLDVGVRRRRVGRGVIVQERILLSILLIQLKYLDTWSQLGADRGTVSFRCSQ